MQIDGPTSALGQAMQAMRAVSERQKINSNNIANAHTPGYTAQQVSFSDLLKSDNPFETRLSQTMGSKMIEVTGGSGMPVDLQKELIDMQKNMLFYSMATRRASTIISTLKTSSQIGR